MVRFPHSAVITWSGPAGYNDSNGSFTKGQDNTLTIKGRAIVQGESSLISTEDGKKIQAKYKFISRLVGVKIPYNADIQITFPDFVHKATVLRHDNFQTFSEIWL